MTQSGGYTIMAWGNHDTNQGNDIFYDNIYGKTVYLFGQEVKYMRVVDPPVSWRYFDPLDDTLGNYDLERRLDIIDDFRE